MIPIERQHAVARAVLFQEPHPADVASCERYFGPPRLPGTVPIGRRKTHPELFQDTLASPLESYEGWLARTLARTLRETMTGRFGECASGEGDGVAESTVQAAAGVLEYATASGLALCDAIPQQTYEDVFVRTIGMVVDGRHSRKGRHPYHAFNALGRRLGLALLATLEEEGGPGRRNTNLARLIHVAVLSGHVGINLKSTASAASALLNRDLVPIPREWVTDLTSVRAVPRTDLKRAARELLDLAGHASGKFGLDAFERYRAEVCEVREPVLVVFFSDDYLESILDLKRFEVMLEGNPCLRVLFVPRNGRYGNDLAFEDLPDVLAAPQLAGLAPLIRQRRMAVSAHGPRGGCVDPRDVSRFLIEQIEACGRGRRIVLETKGCRNFEMLQGQLPVPWYAAFNCNRALSIRTVGVDGPPVFLRIPPGLKAYDGFDRPRIGTSPSYRTAGVRFAGMTTHRLFAALQRPVYRRLLSWAAGDEHRLHALLQQWMQALPVYTVDELLRDLEERPQQVDRLLQRPFGRVGGEGAASADPFGFAKRKRGSQDGR